MKGGPFSTSPGLTIKKPWWKTSYLLTCGLISSRLADILQVEPSYSFVKLFFGMGIHTEPAPSSWGANFASLRDGAFGTRKKTEPFKAILRKGLVSYIIF